METLTSMKNILLCLFLICALYSSGQEYLDKKIIVTVSDTANLYQRVRIAFGKNDFQLKEDGDSTVVSTFARDLKKTPGYMIGRAVLSGNTVTISGRYGLLRIDDWGRTRETSSWKDLVYMKNSKIWPVLEKVASNLKGDIAYSQ
jgi:hypothetical protein